MDKQWEMVRDFHVKFQHPVSNNPQFLSKERMFSRAKWMQEELDEFSGSVNVYEQVDAMIDLIYFALGTLVEIGIRPVDAFEIVHDANMSKLWPDGKPHYDEDGKTIKPMGWVDPEPLLRKLINQRESK